MLNIIITDCIFYSLSLFDIFFYCNTQNSLHLQYGVRLFHFFHGLLIFLFPFESINIFLFTNNLPKIFRDWWADWTERNDDGERATRDGREKLKQIVSGAQKNEKGILILFIPNEKKEKRPHALAHSHPLYFFSLHINHDDALFWVVKRKTHTDFNKYKIITIRNENYSDCNIFEKFVSDESGDVHIHI